MAKTDPINTANPAGSSDPKQGDDHIRTLARAVAEILGVDHYTGSSSPYNEDAAGQHKQVTLNAPLTTAPTTTATQQAIFTSGMDSGAAELFVRPLSDGTPIQLTSGGTILFASLGSIANNTWFKAANAAGDGTVDIIKAFSDDAIILPIQARLNSTDDPVNNAALVHKKYVDDQIAALVLPSGLSGASDSNSETAIGGLEIKWGKLTVSGQVDVGWVADFSLTAFTTQCYQVFVVSGKSNGTGGEGIHVYSIDKDGFSLNFENATNVTPVRVFAIGY